MRVLLSDGSSLTSRQCATLLAGAGHQVGVLLPQPLALTRATVAVRRWHRVPRYGPDPLGWAAAALAVLDAGGYDVILPTSEQVAVLSLLIDDVTRRGAATAVPPYSALCRVQDKLAAEALLTQLGLPRPRATVAAAPEQLLCAALPAYLKAPIGTASTGVRYATSTADLAAAVPAFTALGAFGLGGVLIQQPVAGPLVMVQAVFDNGRLVAASASRRDREGASGGASLKTTVPLGPITTDLERLGTALTWHGALSLDVIDSPDGPVIVDINPRLVEPGNAAAAGLDLVATLLEVAGGLSPRRRPDPKPDVRTHQLLLALLAAAATAKPRRALVFELARAATHSGPYRHSREELTPLAGDPIAAVALVSASCAAPVRPVHKRAPRSQWW